MHDEYVYIDLMKLLGTLEGTDRWLFKPGLVSLMTIAALGLLCQLPGWISFLLIPLSLLAYGIAFVVILGLTVYCLVKKRARIGASILLILLLPVLLWRPMNWALDMVHLGLTAGFGIGQLGAPSKSSDGSFVAYDWSVGLAGGPNTFLIHDVTDEIALPMAQHKHPSSSENGFGKECAGRVHHLLNHYYICTF